ncbi:hypothetical protein FD12_GL001347 [Lentilactobacillus rapi DSM 19907 = JCM 15042]|uniref:Uncharacterized protein n=1 Tax=Lentilactobacillus rapi DSM 19907 = JCM 15042 TaxID=1423795 RepID=A0ABR5PB47_9LACO|nr:hypothetical protein FD12_GL001347 [Lentilactobacillus rapi DSM 19907 = JCM 15042]
MKFLSVNNKYTYFFMQYRAFIQLPFNYDDYVETFTSKTPEIRADNSKQIQ